MTEKYTLSSQAKANTAGLRLMLFLEKKCFDFIYALEAILYTWQNAQFKLGDYFQNDCNLSSSSRRKKAVTYRSFLKCFSYSLSLVLFYSTFTWNFYQFSSSPDPKQNVIPNLILIHMSVLTWGWEEQKACKMLPVLRTKAQEHTWTQTGQLVMKLVFPSALASPLTMCPTRPHSIRETLPLWKEYATHFFMNCLSWWMRLTANANQSPQDK